MKYIFALLLLAGYQSIIAQTVEPAQSTSPIMAAPVALAPPDNKKSTLNDRFQYMRSKAESYQDYKVIKTSTLDAE